MRAVGIVAAGLLVPWLIGCGGEELSPAEQEAAFMEHVSQGPGSDAAAVAEADRGDGAGTGGGGGMGRGGGGGQGQGGGAGYGRPHRRLPNRWRPMDSDEDDQLSKAEFLVVSDVSEEFDRVDSDGDGLLVPDEIRPAQPLHRALGEKFEHLDADGDAQVVEEEWNGAFEAFDADSDGALTPDELRSGANKELAGVLLGWFSHFDREPEGANNMLGDLKITRDEWSVSFSELDRIDPDGRLVRAEVLAGVGLRRELGAGVRSRPFRDFPPRFQQMDQDGDESISAEEFQGGEEEFARLDRDGDGLLTVQEVRYGVPTVFALIYRMEAIDTDASETISFDEWHHVLESLDSTGDGKFDRDELRAVASSEEGEPTRPILARMVLEHFSHFDRDRDGNVTKTEWQKQFMLFDQAPRGELTPEELRGGVRRHAVLDAQQRLGTE